MRTSSGHYALVADVVEVFFGDSERERLSLTVFGRSHPGCSDFWDGNWLRTTVAVHVGGFTGNFGADLRAEEFRSFSDELKNLYETLEGEAAFTTMEGQVSVVLRGDGLGHVAVSAELLDVAGIGNRLHCRFHIDQSYLPMVIDSLSDIDARWPVLGRP